MEFILIGDGKIKVSLTKEDLEEFELSADELDYANTETKRMFWDVLSRAKARTGFDTDGEKVLVQLYPSKDGGCEIFVTKIGSLYKEDEELVAGSALAESIGQRRKRKTASAERSHSAVYSFLSLDDMIRVCRELERRGYAEGSRAYVSDAKVFYLVLSGDIEKISTLGDHFRFICEFGEPENSKAAKQLLSEHADTIATANAVSLLSLC